MAYYLFLKPFILSALISVITTPLVIYIFQKKNWLDIPDKNKKNTTHTQPVPRGGGISIFTAIFLSIIFFLNIDSQIRAIFLASLLTLSIGVLDDIFNLNPYIRLVTNLISALIIVNSGIYIQHITNPFGPHILNLDFNLWIFNFGQTITLVWLVWCMNFVGWSAGIPGQLPGLITISSIIIGLLSLNFAQDITQWPIIVLAGTIAGAHWGFLPFNFYPQKMMPGYSGKSLAGLLVGILAILSGAKLATLILTLGLPMVDAIWAIFRRLIKGKIPVWGDAKHVHHLLIKLGVPKPIITVFYWLFSLIIGLIVLQLNSRQKMWTLVMIVILVSGFILTLHRLVKNRT